MVEEVGFAAIEAGNAAEAVAVPVSESCSDIDLVLMHQHFRKHGRIETGSRGSPSLAVDQNHCGSWRSPPSENDLPLSGCNLDKPFLIVCAEIRSLIDA